MKTNNLLPFDWKIALNNPEKIVTRDGRRVTQIVKFDLKNEYDQPICGVIDGQVQFWYENGVYMVGGQVSSTDLFIEAELKQCWINVHDAPFGLYISKPFSSKEIAISEIDNLVTYIKTIPITDLPE